MKINIKGIDKAVLLAAMWNQSKALGMGFFNAEHNSQMTVEQARGIIEQKALKLEQRAIELYGSDNINREAIQKSALGFEYLNGRVMKINISGDELSPDFYDNYNGPGKAQEVIDLLKLGMKQGFNVSFPQTDLECECAAATRLLQLLKT